MQDVIFFKYEGAGNDFILVDGIKNPAYISLNQTQIAFLCHRRFGIGADGLMILGPSERYDFDMIYFNSDGNLSSMCGNGGRCIASFANKSGYIEKQCTFSAPDGIHTATILENELVTLSMNDVSDIKIINSGRFELNTGSPHYVEFIMEDLSLFDMKNHGRKIRYSESYKDKGINVNAVTVESENTLHMRTYERGVEDETLSCGTGVTAAALAYIYHQNKDMSKHHVEVHTQGGVLTVQASYKDQIFSNITLIGPAKYVFEGKIILH